MLTLLLLVILFGIYEILDRYWDYKRDVKSDSIKMIQEILTDENISQDFKDKLRLYVNDNFDD